MKIDFVGQDRIKRNALELGRIDVIRLGDWLASPLFSASVNITSVSFKSQRHFSLEYFLPYLASEMAHHLVNEHNATNV